MVLVRKWIGVNKVSIKSFYRNLTAPCLTRFYRVSYSLKAVAKSTAGIETPLYTEMQGASRAFFMSIT